MLQFQSAAAPGTEAAGEESVMQEITNVFNRLVPKSLSHFAFIFFNFNMQAHNHFIWLYKWQRATLRD